MSGSQFNPPRANRPSLPVKYPHLVILLAISEKPLTKIQIQAVLMTMFSYDMHNSTFFQHIRELQRWQLGVCNNPETELKKNLTYSITPDGYELSREFLMALNQLPYGFSGLV